MKRAREGVIRKGRSVERRGGVWRKDRVARSGRVWRKVYEYGEKCMNMEKMEQVSNIRHKNSHPLSFLYL